MIKFLYYNEDLIISALAESLVIGGLPMRKEKIVSEDITKEIEELTNFLKMVHKNKDWFVVSKENKTIKPNDKVSCTQIKEYCEKFEKYIKRGITLGNVPTGSGHNSMFKGVAFNMIIEFPLYWLKEYQRYHFTDIISSQSTMHKILEFDLKDMFGDKVDRRSVAVIEELRKEYNEEADRDKKKEIWEKIINSCPDGLHMAMGITMNYLQASSIIEQRKHHKLSEWSKDFVPFLKGLPFYDLFLE